MPNDDQDLLEALIDKYGLSQITNVLASICTQKAEHLATNWQDAATAKSWERDAEVLENAYNLIDNQ